MNRQRSQIKSNHKLQGWPRTAVMDWSFKSTPFLVFQSGLPDVRLMYSFFVIVNNIMKRIVYILNGL